MSACVCLVLNIDNNSRFGFFFLHFMLLCGPLSIISSKKIQFHDCFLLLLLVVNRRPRFHPSRAVLCCCRGDLLLWLPLMTGEDETIQPERHWEHLMFLTLNVPLFSRIRATCRIFPNSKVLMRSDLVKNAALYSLLRPDDAYLHIPVKLCMMLTQRGSCGGTILSSVASMQGRPNSTRYLT